MNTMGHRLCCKHKKWDFNVWKYSFRINTQHSLAAAGSWTNLCSTHIVFIPNTFPDHPSCGSLLNWYWKVTNGWMSGGWNYIWKSVAAARSAALTQLSVERTCRIAAFSLNNEPEKITNKSSKGNFKKMATFGGVCFLHLFDPIAQNGTCASKRRGNFCLVSQPGDVINNATG